MNIFKIFELIAKAKEWLRGKKVYLLGIGTITGILIAWSNNAVDTKTMMDSIWGSLVAMALRAGQDNAAVKAATALPSQIAGNDPVAKP
jgi:hypothetical protein